MDGQLKSVSVFTLVFYNNLNTMKSVILAIAGLSLFQATLAAPAVKARDCASIPSTADPAVRDQVYRVTQSRGVTAKVLLATFEVIQPLCSRLWIQIANIYAVSDCLDRVACQRPVSRMLALLFLLLKLFLFSVRAVTKTPLASFSSALAKVGVPMTRSWMLNIALARCVALQDII